MRGRSHVAYMEKSGFGAAFKQTLRHSKTVTERLVSTLSDSVSQLQVQTNNTRSQKVLLPKFSCGDGTIIIQQVVTK